MCVCVAMCVYISLSLKFVLCSVCVCVLCLSIVPCSFFSVILLSILVFIYSVTASTDAVWHCACKYVNSGHSSKLLPGSF